VREIRTLRVMWRGLETRLRSTWELSRQSPTLPGTQKLCRIWAKSDRQNDRVEAAAAAESWTCWRIAGGMAPILLTATQGGV
jgi:hypothetical protein